MPYEANSASNDDDASKAAAFRQHLKENSGSELLGLLIDFINALRTLPVARSTGPTLMQIALGELEGRPYDVSSLSVTLGQPRTSVFRLLEEMEELEVVALTRKGRRTTVRLTDAGWVRLAANLDTIRPSLDRLVLNETSRMAEDQAIRASK